jgi:arylsulfatase A-like enzyme
MITIKLISKSLTLLACLIVCLIGSGSIFAKKKPNIVFIISDDVGFEEIGCYDVIDRESITPNIDSLAEKGVRFNTCYAQAICGPSRAMLYTGNYAVHTGQYDNKLKYLKSDAETVRGRRSEHRNYYQSLPCLTKIMKDGGYSVGWAGKWHHTEIAGGHVHKISKEIGIDTYIEYSSNPKMYEKLIGRKMIPDDTWERSAIGGEPIISRYWKPGFIKDGQMMETDMDDYGPDILANFICEEIKKDRPDDQPFFLMYTMNLAHSAHCVTPYEVAAGASPDNTHIRKGSPEGAEIFKSQVRYMDALVGRIIDTVEAQGLSEDTIIIYTSDNGTTSSAKAKGVEYGVHVPFVLSGPQINITGQTDELMDFTDILPTFAEWAEVDLGDEKYDGISLAPFLSGSSSVTKPVIYSFPGPARLIRTKTHLLEAVSPLYDQARGKLYKTNGSFDGKGYENLALSDDYLQIQSEFEHLKARLPSVLPESFSDIIWEREEMQKAKVYFDDAKRKRLTLSLPKDYAFYDDSL